MMKLFRCKNWSAKNWSETKLVGKTGQKKLIRKNWSEKNWSEKTGQRKNVREDDDNIWLRVNFSTSRPSEKVDYKEFSC